MQPTPPPISPIKAKLNQFRLDRQRKQEAILSDDGEHLRKAIENNSWNLVRRMLDVPGAHPETDRLYPKGVISPVSIDALKEVSKRDWTILMCLCYQGAPAALVVHTITRILTEEEERDGFSDDDDDDDDEEEEIDWNADPEEDGKVKETVEEDLEEDEPSEPHPVSLLDDLKNNCLHLLFARSTKDGDGTKRPSRSETVNTLNIATTLLTFDPHLASMKNLNRHTPLHVLLSSTGAGGRINIKLLKLLKKCHDSVIEDVTPSNATPLHLLCLLNSPCKVVELMLEWYPQAIKMLDGKGRTPLHCCLLLKEPQVNIIKLLVSKFRFALNILDKHGKTPLITAVVTAGGEHPPPLALMNLLKGDDEWFHPHPQVYRSFDWYASGTKKHPHVYGCDFDNVDVTTPTVLNSTKVKISNNPEDHSKSRKNLCLSPRAKAMETVRNRLPSSYNKMTLEVISPIRGKVYAKHTEAQFNSQISSQVGSFSWYAEGNTTGKDMLGNLPSDERADRLSNSINDAHQQHRSMRINARTSQGSHVRTLPGSPKSSNSHLSPNKRNRMHSPMSTTSSTMGSNDGTSPVHERTRAFGGSSNNRFQLSSTTSGQNRVDVINTMNLSPRYKSRLNKKALSGRTYEKSTLRGYQMDGSLRSKYFKHPILLRNETPEATKEWILNLPEHVVDANESRRREHIL